MLQGIHLSCLGRFNLHCIFFELGLYAFVFVLAVNVVTVVMFFSYVAQALPVITKNLDTKVSRNNNILPSDRTIYTLP